MYNTGVWLLGAEMDRLARRVGECVLAGLGNVVTPCDRICGGEHSGKPCPQALRGFVVFDERVWVDVRSAKEVVGLVGEVLAGVSGAEVEAPHLDTSLLYDDAGVGALFRAESGPAGHGGESLLGGGVGVTEGAGDSWPARPLWEVGAVEEV